MARYIPYIFIAALLLMVVGVVIADDPPGCVQPCVADTGISGGSISGPSEVCVDTNATFSISGSDNDRCGDPVNCPDGVHGSWSWGSGAVASGTMSKANSYCTHGYPTSLTCKWTTTGTKQISTTLNDDGKWAGDSGSVTRYKTVTVLGLDSISGPTTVHMGANATFTAHGTFGSKASEISWGGGDDPSSGSGTSYTTKWNSGGLKTVTATFCQKSISMDVLVLVPCTECCCLGCSEETPCNWYDPRVGCDCPTCPGCSGGNCNF